MGDDLDLPAGIGFGRGGGEQLVKGRACSFRTPWKQGAPLHPYVPTAHIWAMRYAALLLLLTACGYPNAPGTVHALQAVNLSAASLNVDLEILKLPDGPGLYARAGGDSTCATWIGSDTVTVQATLITRPSGTRQVAGVFVLVAKSATPRITARYDSATRGSQVIVVQSAGGC